MACYALSLHAPSSIQTALALRQAIWRKGDPHWCVCGIPETFYTDHGSDFTSQPRFVLEVRKGYGRTRLGTSICAQSCRPEKTQSW